jgi:lambda repressor-like predicted transcriptional regulator
MTRKSDTWPKKVEHFANEARAWTSMRDEAIQQMRAEGASLRTIAQAAGLSHSAIVKILARRVG